ncbi:MAG: periplasmic heavy metal sensor [bacterium]|nr:periplasmic heavy metal sensor [bacterium]
MKTRILFIILIVSLALNLGILFKIMTGKTQSTGSHDDSCNNWKACSSCLDLALSKEQITKLEKYHLHFKKELEPVKSRLKEEREKLLQLLKKDSLDKQGTQVHITNIAQLQTNVQTLFVLYFFEVKGILTPGQKDKIFIYFHREMCATGMVIGKAGGSAYGNKSSKGAAQKHSPKKNINSAISCDLRQFMLNQ